MVAVSPNPHSGPVSTMTITFSEPVDSLPLADLQLSLNGGSNLLDGSQTDIEQ